MKKISTIILSTILCFSAFTMTSCKPNGSTSGDTPSTPTIKATEHDLIKNGVSDYAIVLPQKATATERLCATELNTFFAEASGIVLPIIEEGQSNADPINKYISIGNTDKANENSVTIDGLNLGSSGYALRTVGDDVYILGSNPGVVYGAYEFLEQQFSYHYYSDGVYKINKGVSNSKLLDFEETDIPDIEYRHTSYGFEKAPKDSMYTYRMRLSEMVPDGVGGVLWHNFFAAIPKSKHQEAHSNWYSPDGNQLCLTRDLDGLANEMKNVVVDMLEKDPTIKFVHIGMEDSTVWCDCSECSNVITQYGGYQVSTYILFMNKVADLVKPYCEEQKLDIKFTMFAYHGTDDAPVEADPVNGGYKLISNDLKLRDNIYVLYAPIDADYYVPFDDSANTVYKKNMIGWNLVASKVMLWIYQENFRDYLTPFDNFNSMQANLQLATENHVVMCFNQAQWNNNESTGFSHLKAYISSKLQWDSNANVRELIEGFFEGYYADGADVMLEIFDEWRAWRSYCYYEKDVTGSVYFETTQEHWPYALLKKWLDKFDEATQNIEKYKLADYDKYKQLKDAITLDSLAFRYQMIRFNSSYYTAMELIKMQKDFKKDATTLGISRHSEEDEISTIWSSWGLS